eukprot:Gb_23004 [translate_table: standard]
MSKDRIVKEKFQWTVEVYVRGNFCATEEELNLQVTKSHSEGEPYFARGLQTPIIPGTAKKRSFYFALPSVGVSELRSFQEQQRGKASIRRTSLLSMNLVQQLPGTNGWITNLLMLMAMGFQSVVLEPTILILWVICEGNLESMHQALGRIADLLHQMNEKQQKVRHPPLEESYAYPQRDKGEKRSTSLTNASQSSQLRDKKRSEREMVVKKLCVENIDDNDHLSSIISVKEATCYIAPQKSSKRVGGSPNLSTCFVVVTNQECSSIFRSSNLEILLYNPAPNDSILEGSYAEGLFESKKHDLKGVNHNDGQNALIVGTLAMDVDDRGCVNFRGFLKVTGRHGSRVCSVVSSNTQMLIEEQVCFLAGEIIVISSIPEQCQAGFMLENVKIVDERGNIDADINGHWNFNNKTMIKTVAIKRWSLVTYSPSLSPTKDLDVQARQKRSRDILLSVANIGVARVQSLLLWHRWEVYTAHLHSGEVVAIKVQRLSMPLVLALDAHLIHMIGSQLRHFAKARGDLLAAVNEIVRHMFDEIDYILEEQNAEHFAALYSFDADFESFFKYCGLGRDGDKRRKTTSSYDHNGLIGMLVHFVNPNSLGLGNDFLSLGFIPEGANIQLIANALHASFGDKATKSHLDFQRITNQLSDVMYKHKFSLPPDYALIIRALGSLEGTTKTLGPDFKVVASAYPFIIYRLLADPDPNMRKSLRELLIRNNGSIQWHRLEYLVIAITEQTSVTNKDNGPQNEMGQAKVRGWSLSFDIALDASLQEELFGYLYPERSVATKGSGISTDSQQSKNENGTQKQWVSCGRDERSQTSWNQYNMFKGPWGVIEEAVADLLRSLFSSPDLWHHEATKSGARIVHDEQITEVPNYKERNSIGLALLTNVTNDIRCYKEGICEPIFLCMKAGSFSLSARKAPLLQQKIVFSNNPFFTLNALRAKYLEEVGMLRTPDTQWVLMIG